MTTAKKMKNRGLMSCMPAKPKKAFNKKQGPKEARLKKRNPNKRMAKKPNTLKSRVAQKINKKDHQKQLRKIKAKALIGKKNPIMPARGAQKKPRNKVNTNKAMVKKKNALKARAAAKIAIKAPMKLRNKKPMGKKPTALRDRIAQKKPIKNPLKKVIDKKQVDKKLTALQARGAPKKALNDLKKPLKKLIDKKQVAKKPTALQARGDQKGTIKAAARAAPNKNFKNLKKPVNIKKPNALKNHGAPKAEDAKKPDKVNTNKPMIKKPNPFMTPRAPKVKDPKKLRDKVNTNQPLVEKPTAVQPLGPTNEAPKTDAKKMRAKSYGIIDARVQERAAHVCFLEQRNHVSEPIHQGTLSCPALPKEEQQKFADKEE